MKSPISYFGGKGLFTKKLMPLLPAHIAYVEPFGGAASLLFAKSPSPVEVYNDIDEAVVNFFRVLRDKDLGAELARRSQLTPYSRKEYNYARDHWAEQDDPLERAYLWFIFKRMSFAACSSWSFARYTSVRGMAKPVSGWITTTSALRMATERLMRVQIECDSWEAVIDRYDGPDTLFYCDPPYPHATRSSGGYTYEMSDDDHERLVDRLLRVDGKVLLSSYENDIYARLLSCGWQIVKWKTVAFSVGATRGTKMMGPGSRTRANPRTEVVYISPKAQFQLRLWD